MRIALVTRVYPTHRPGGMPFVVQDRAERLAVDGHDVHVITTSLSPNSGKMGFVITRVENGVTVHYTNSPSHNWTAGFASECERAVSKLNPDMLHSDSFDRERIWWRGMDMNITMHGFTLGAWLTSWNMHRAYGGPLAPFPAPAIKEEIRALGLARRVVAVSRWEYRMLRDQYGLDPVLVYNPIAPYFFEPGSASAQGAYFLCAAVSQGANRGFRQAAAAARTAGVRLVTAHDKPRRTMPGLYDQAIALLLPTAFAQGYDLSVAEARARGVPAIVTSTGSYLDEAEWWDTLVPIGDQNKLATLLATYTRPLLPPSSDISNPAHKHLPGYHTHKWLEAVG